MTVDLGINLEDEGIERLANRLLEGWILIAAGPAYYDFIEQKFYMDNNNELFELMVLPPAGGQPIRIYAIIKPTEALLDDWTIPDPENIVAIDVIEQKNEGILIETRELDRNTKTGEAAIRRFCKRLIKGTPTVKED